MKYEYSLIDIVNKYDSYKKYQQFTYYLMFAVVIGSYFIYAYLTILTFLTYFSLTRIRIQFVNLLFFKWIYANNIRPERLLHSYKTRNLVEDSYTINACMRWSSPESKQVLRAMRSQIDDIDIDAVSFDEEIDLDNEYIIEKDKTGGYTLIIVFSLFALLISYNNKGTEYLLQILLIAVSLLTIVYMRRRRPNLQPLLIIDNQGIHVRKLDPIKWKDIRALHIADESDSEDTSYLLHIDMRNGDEREFEVSSSAMPVHQLEIILKAYLLKAKKTPK